MVTRRRGELYTNRQQGPTISMFHCRTHAWDGDERETRGEERREERGQDSDKRETRRRGDSMVTRERGQLYANRQEPTISMFHCRTHAWDSDEREMRRRGDRLVTRGRREERGRDGDKRERRTLYR